MKHLRIGGLLKFSLIDYPGKFSAVIFTQGCNFRCPWCHNPELVLPEKFEAPLNNDEILKFLESRRSQLEAVSITGGEPTLQEGLEPFLSEISNLGFKIKLDTNGSNPDVLKNLLPWLDYVAMDIKGPLKKYRQITMAKVDIKKIEKSIEVVLKSKKEYEFRTTTIKLILEVSDFEEVGKMIEGADVFYLQNYVASKLVDERKRESFRSFEIGELEEAKKVIEKYVKKVLIR